MWIVVFFSSVGENPDNSWWCLKIPGDTWKYLVIPENTFTIPNNTKQNKTILNNSKQYLTNLETIGIIWYHQYIKYDCQYDTSIILVPSRYGTGGFVSLWYHHNTVSANCQKNLYALSLRRFAGRKLMLSCSFSGEFVQQKLMLSCSFRCDHIYNVVRYEPSHTLLCCLSPT